MSDEHCKCALGLDKTWLDCLTPSPASGGGETTLITAVKNKKRTGAYRDALLTSIHSRCDLVRISGIRSGQQEHSLSKNILKGWQ